MIYYAIKTSVSSIMRPRNSGVAPLFFLILYYRKSVRTIFSINIDALACSEIRFV